MEQNHTYLHDALHIHVPTNSIARISKGRCRIICHAASNIGENCILDSVAQDTLVSEMLRERGTPHVILPLYFAIWSLGTAASAPPAMLLSRR